MIEIRGSDVASAARVAVVLLGLIAATALAVRLLDAGGARSLLGFTFEGVPRRPEEATAIFANNMRVLGALLLATVIARVARGGDRIGWERVLTRTAIAACDIAVIAGCALHVVLIGAAIGAHGRRVIELVLAHGPFELVAFSLALGLYVDARRERLPVNGPLAAAVGAPIALAIGAVLEVYA